MGVVRFLAGSLVGLALLAALGTAAQTAILLIELGAPVSAADVASALARDLAGFTPLYALLLAVPFLLLRVIAAFAAARLWPAGRLALAAAAGALAPLVTLYALEAALGAPPIYGARHALGWAAQAAAGALSGLAAALSFAPPLKR